MFFFNTIFCLVCLFVQWDVRMGGFKEVQILVRMVSFHAVDAQQPAPVDRTSSRNDSIPQVMQD